MADFYDAVMSAVDARIDASRISDDLTLPDDSTVRGRFERQSVILDGVDGPLNGAMYGVTIVFHCPATAGVLALVEGNQVTADGITYKMIRRLPPQGDNNGRVTLELGAIA